MLNIMKSQLSPVQVVDWPGFTLDLRESCFDVLNSKLIICCMQLLPVSWQVLLWVNHFNESGYWANSSLTD